ncbi:MAG: protein O-mannosyl-transferase, partial [Humisphaera sp.]|nr:protein O-mannosyl-transferase [Humisphaera sp.]
SAPSTTTYVAATIFLVLALLAKPAAIVAPVMALIIDRLILRREWREIARSLALWFALIVPFMLVARLVQPAAEVTPTPLAVRPLVAADALAFYLGKLLLPVELTGNYGRTPESILRSGAIYFTWLAPALAALVLWWLGKRRLVAAALLFVAGVLPVLGLTTFLYQQFSTVADRFVYLSMLGPALAAAWIMSRRWTRGSVAIATLLLVALGVQSMSQARVWRNRLTLAQHAVAVQPANPAARSSYAGALIRENRIDEAIVQLEEVMRIMPNDYTADLLVRLRASTRPVTTRPTTSPAE